ncbi:ankyrin repeat-containing protein At5g02620-like [Nicotiana tomentosiformis]|uniref:ankyrin repeat-containing protein At5g02620-like n=1 Tax=Nicotiana tomentosiformis TaxID=4098 RepID=UPI0008791AC5
MDPTLYTAAVEGNTGEGDDFLPQLIAANEGHTEVVHVLLSEGGQEAKQLMMRMADGNGDTALHKAVRKRHFGVVTLLVKEDPEFEFPANNAGETPLYLAVESNFPGALCEILKHCKRLSYSGPCQRTPMHAAVIFKYPECTNLLWQWNKSLCEEADGVGIRCTMPLN